MASVIPRGAQLDLFPQPTGDSPAYEPTVAAPPTALSEAAVEYCRYLTRSNRARHTVRSTELDLGGLVQHLGDAPLASVTPDLLIDHVRWLRSERGNRVSSLRRKIATIKGLFRHAAASGWVASNPAEPIPYPPPIRSTIICLTPSEREAVIAHAGHDPIWCALVLLMIDAGLKRDEVLALRAEDILVGRDPEMSRIMVRRSSDSKRVRRRTVTVTPSLHSALKRLLTGPLSGGHLIGLSVRGVNFVVETIGRRAGLARVRKLTPEILRDTFAVNAMRERMQEERRRASEGAGAEQLARAQREHDREVLDMLGLSRLSDMAARYRSAVAAGD
jgi:integrase/recombinase XerD